MHLTEWVTNQINPELLVLISRFVIALGWSYAGLVAWESRKRFAQANQMLAGSAATVLLQVAAMMYPNMPYATYLFFIAMAQLTLISACVRLMGVQTPHLLLSRLRAGVVLGAVVTAMQSLPFGL